MQLPLHTEKDLQAAAVLDTVTARATLAAIVAFAFLSFSLVIVFILFVCETVPFSAYLRLIVLSLLTDLNSFYRSGVVGASERRELGVFINVH